MSRIGWFDFQEWEEDVKDSDLDIEIYEKSLNHENCDNYDHDYLCVFASSNVGEKVLREIKPKAVFTRSTGYDNIDLDTAEELGIRVFNVPHYGSNTVAEHAFALLLAISKNILQSSERTKQVFDHSGLTGFELKGKKLGIIGTGDIGQEAIKIAKGFGMNVIAYDPYKKDYLEEELGFMYVSKNDLLAKSDIISLHCPLTDKNHHLLDKKAFEKMKNNAVLINTARGGLINSKALLNALKNDNIAAAGLDVMELEDEMRKMQNYEERTNFCSRQFRANCELIHRDDVLVTPHNGFNTKEAKQRIFRTTLRNIKEQPEENRIV